MTSTTRDLITRYYDTLFTGTPQAAIAFFDEAAEYTCYAPVNVFPHLGYRKGKALLLETIEALHHQFDSMSYVPRIIVTEGNNAASMIDARLRRRADKRTIQTNLAHFTRFQNGLIIEHRLYLDSCDAVEQIVGHQLDFTKLLDPHILSALRADA